MQRYATTIVMSGDSPTLIKAQITLCASSLSDAEIIAGQYATLLGGEVDSVDELAG